jgi:putative nucleotidyltransferase with HDIG domain
MVGGRQHPTHAADRIVQSTALARTDFDAGRIRATTSTATALADNPVCILDLYALSARTGLVVDDDLRAMSAQHARGLAGVAEGALGPAFLRLGGRAIGRAATLAALHAMRDDGVLAHAMPAVTAGHGVTQNDYHAFTVEEHLLQAAASATEVRMGDGRFFVAALLHDIGKPGTRTVGEDGRVHFYGHEQLGAEMAEHILSQGPLSMAADDRNWIVEVIRKHMRLALMGKRPGRKAVHGFVAGLEAGVTLSDMLDFRRADKLGAGVEERVPQEDWVAWVRDRAAEPVPGPRKSELAISGREVMEVLGLKPGPEVGRVLKALEEMVGESPELNTRDHLMGHIVGPARRVRAKS